MDEVVINREEVCANFSKIYWHDSKLIDLHILKRRETPPSYDVLMDLDLIVGFSAGKVEMAKHTAIFRDCRIIQANLDLLGVTLCGGDIACGVCYADPLELLKKRPTAHFDLPQDRNPLPSCLGFLIQMIPPGGEIVIFARDFKLMQP